jgi:hypothetical protein
MTTRRHFLTTLAASLAAMTINPAWAAAPMLEIVAMQHPPVIAALKPLRAWIAQQGGKLRVVEIDAESPTGEKRFQAAGLSGHIPILLLIDGQHVFKRRDGSRVALVKFPNVTGSPPGMRGDWVTADVVALLDERSGGKQK